MREIQLPRGTVALVDDADYGRVIEAGPWHAATRPLTETVYVQRHVPPTTQYLHNFLTGLPYVDHRNGNGLDNQRANLRESTHAQNMANSRRRKDNTSGFKGVSQERRTGRWVAQIQRGGHNFHLGTFGSPEDAARAYDAKAAELFGEFARPNFPPAPKELTL